MYHNLKTNVVNLIKKQVEEARKKYGIVNAIIRNDILKILEEQCTVLYYPLEDENANGVHVKRYIKGKERHFVFINTSNPLEKQVYTAAHELGHVWNIDIQVNDHLEEPVDPEDIINRFAAELLMPDWYFAYEIDKKMQELGIAGKTTLQVEEYMPLTVYLMDVFMVPYKSIVYRYEELGYIEEKAREILLGLERNQMAVIEAYIRRGQFVNLNQTNRKKAIGNLDVLLKIAREKQMYSPEKLSAIGRLFEIEEIDTGTEQEEEKEKIRINIPRE